MTTALKTGTPAACAREIAVELVQCLEPVCAEVHVAGSLRREKREVKDIELVACLHDGDTMPLHLAEHMLNQKLLNMMLSGVLALHTTLRPNGKRTPTANGGRFKKLVVPGSGPDIAIDLFICERSNCGNILAIRTGDAEFSRRMVMPVGRGGLMPLGYKQDDGYLWYDEGKARGDSRPISRPRRIDCPTEEAFFSVLGVPTLPPAERDIKAIARLRAGLGY